MTNLEWVRTLSAKELAKLLDDDCCMCSKSKGGCDMNCKSGYITWLNAEHIKPCANCGGEAKFVVDVMRIFPETGYVKCCKCGMRTSFGKKNDMINTWNRRVSNE